MESHDRICTVCREIIMVFAFGSCDHVVCYKCATRMRVLCELKYCAICRTELREIVLTKSPVLFKDIDMRSFLSNSKYGFMYENVTIREKVNALLEHLCPVCPKRSSFRLFEDLNRHIRRVHEMFYCDICVKHLKIFTWERKHYDRKMLATHRRIGDPDDPSYKGHPLCQFCSERYLDKDELGRHLYKEHFHCHFCDDNHFYSGYEELRGHFLTEHFLCEEGECQEARFTNSFSSDADLRMHRMTCHAKNLKKSQVRQGLALDVELQLPPRLVQGGNQERGGRSGRGGKSARSGHNVNRASSTPTSKGNESLPNTNDVEQFPSLSRSCTSHPVSVAPDNSLASRLAHSSGYSTGSISFVSSCDNGGNTRQSEKFTITNDDLDEFPVTGGSGQRFKNVDKGRNSGISRECDSSNNRFADSTWVTTKTSMVSDNDFPALPKGPKPKNDMMKKPNSWVLEDTSINSKTLPSEPLEKPISKSICPVSMNDFPSLPTTDSPQMLNQATMCSRGLTSGKTAKQKSNPPVMIAALKNNKSTKSKTLLDVPMTAEKMEQSKGQGHKNDKQEVPKSKKDQAEAVNSGKSKKNTNAQFTSSKVNKNESKSSNTKIKSKSSLSEIDNETRKQEAVERDCGGDGDVGHGAVHPTVTPEDFPSLPVAPVMNLDAVPVFTLSDKCVSDQLVDRSTEIIPEPLATASFASLDDHNDFPALSRIGTAPSSSKVNVSKRITGSTHLSQPAQNGVLSATLKNSENIKCSRKGKKSGKDGSLKVNCNKILEDNLLQDLRNNETPNAADDMVSEDQPKKPSINKTLPISEPLKPSTNAVTSTTDNIMTKLLSGFASSKPPPPGFNITDNCKLPPPGFTSCNGAPPVSHTVQSNHAFIPPLDYQNRNRELILNVRAMLNNDDDKFTKFKHLSSDFRQGDSNADYYYTQCEQLFQYDLFHVVFPELLVLLPDLNKQQDLLSVYKSHSKASTTVAYTVQFISCPQCHQVLLKRDYSMHMSMHQGSVNNL